MYSRLRVTAEIPALSQSAIGYYKLKNSPYTKAQNQTFAMTLPSITNYMNDVVTPGFHQLIASGAIINNAMMKIDTARVYTSNISGWTSTTADLTNTFEGTGSVTQYYVGRHSGGAIISGSDIDSSFVQDHENDTIKALKQQTLANLDRTPYNFAEDVAELHSTLQLLRHPLEQLVDLASTTARKHKLISRRERDKMRSLKHIAAAAKQASKAWLAMRFAYGSIYYSADQMLTEYLDPVKNKATRRRAGDEVNHSETRTSSYTRSKYPGAENAYFTHKISYTSSIRVGCLYEVTNPIDTWRERNNLRLKAVPVTLWNIIPYTWATDRLFDVSKTIKGLTNLADPELKILAAWVSKESSLRDVLTCTSCWNATNTVSFSPDEFGYLTTTKSRSVWDPYYADTFPSFTNPFKDSVPGTLDLVSLLMLKLKLFHH